MKKLFYILTLCFFASIAGANHVNIAFVESGSATPHWVGFPNSSGTPSSPTGSWDVYGNSSDRTYARLWTATENGTITHVNVRIGEGWNPGANGGYVVIYNGTALIGSVALSSPSTETWTGELSLTLESGESWNFSTNDELRFGISFDGSGSETHIGRDTGDSTNMGQYSSATVTTPPDPITWSASGSYGGLGCILRYNER